MRGLNASPDAKRVLVEHRETDAVSATTNQFGGRGVFHLRCDPASGNVPDPVKACAAISAQPSLITKQARPRPAVEGPEPTHRALARRDGHGLGQCSGTSPELFGRERVGEAGRRPRRPAANRHPARASLGNAVLVVEFEHPRALVRRIHRVPHPV